MNGKTEEYKEKGKRKVSPRRHMKTRKPRRMKLERPAPPAPPSVAEIEKYCQLVGLSPDVAEKFFDYYEARGWVLRDDRPIMNWQAVARMWKRNQDEWALRQ